MGILVKLVGLLFVAALIAVGLAAWQNQDEAKLLFKQLAGEEVTSLIDEETNVVASDAAILMFSVPETARVRLEVDLGHSLPIDIIMTQGHISKTEYVMNVGIKELSDLIAVFSPEHKAQDFFSHPLSKRAAIKKFSSAWATLEPGDYSIILDNTDAFSPSRGDATATVKLFYLPGEGNLH